MRSLSCLALAVAALTSIACGGPAPSSGNAYVSEAALGGVGGPGGEAVADQPTRLVAVAVDGTDFGCTVDSVRYSSCTLTRTSVVDVAGLSVDLCGLDVGNRDGFDWQCGIDDDLAEFLEVEAFPWHCPSGH